MEWRYGEAAATEEKEDLEATAATTARVYTGKKAEMQNTRNTIYFRLHLGVVDLSPLRCSPFISAIWPPSSSTESRAPTDDIKRELMVIDDGRRGGGLLEEKKRVRED
ncbi:unnamed protein product [Linum tenue]|uniref:Uncharacterized protein n=1 Tax=Linum tenue TaxID=586396 RepID=A0AAV0L9U3_9ROSI|nr:unnamed protein product [Linum tenue]